LLGRIEEIEYLKYEVIIRTNKLWVSTYTHYQEHLSDQIIELRDVFGLTFNQISDRLNGEGKLTPRKCSFEGNHVFSIYMKRKRMLERFEKDNEVTIRNITIER
jgi:hypothetical protein